MKLQTKFIGAFSLLAIITLAVSAIGFWQANNLASALYEVGAVRLPSIQGLDMINEAMTSIRASDQILLISGIDDAIAAVQLEQQKSAFERVNKGWRLYEPLPQTEEEAAKWRAFIPAWTTWKTNHDTMVALIVESRAVNDQRLLEKARAQNKTKTAKLAEKAESLLADIITINFKVADEAKQRSVASREDMSMVDSIMVFSALIGVVGALCFGFFMSRTLSKPVTQMSYALERIAKGDLTTAVTVRSNDEVGQMAKALNDMVESLRTSEVRLRALSDNLPNGMVYQVIREHDGSMRFQYVSAGVERLHGVSAEAVMENPELLYTQIFDEDKMIVREAENASASAMSVFSVIARFRRSDGGIRWLQLSSSPRRLRDGRILWDGIETDITERMLAEEAIRRSEERFSKAFQSSPVAISATRMRDGKFLELNTAMEKFLGYARSELIGKTTLEIGAWADLDDRKRVVEQLTTIGSVLDQEVRFRTKDGKVVVSRYSAEVIDLGGEQCILSVLVDITETKRSEVLRAAEAQVLEMIVTGESLSDILDMVTRTIESQSTRMFCSILLLDPDGIHLRHGAAPTLPKEYVRAIDGQPIGPNAGSCGTAAYRKKPVFVSDIASDPLWKDYKELALKHGLRSCWSTPIRRIDGRVLGTFAIYYAEPRDPSPADVDLVERAIHIAGIAIERKRAEEQMEQQARLLDVARDAIIVRGMDEELVYMNRAAEQMYGWTRQEVASMRSEEFSVESDREKFRASLQTFMEKGEWEGELRQKTKEGKELIIQARWTLVRDKGGMPTARLIINRDVTEQRKLEVQFRRTQRLDSLGTLAGGIAHDLNNVLAPIMMSLALLDQKTTDPSLKKWITALETSARRGSDIVRQVLMFARGSEKDFSPQQLRYVIRELVSIIQQTFPKNIEFSTGVSGDLPYISGDATQLHQVLMNLCVNARDAMPEGGRITISASDIMLESIDLKAQPGFAPGPYVCLSISDTGSGIPKEIQEKIFEPFFTTKEVGKGTGLGLSTVYSIIKDHGGFINLYSEVGKGTAFKIYLPAIKGSDIVQSSLEERNLPQGHGETILVVDDEHSVLEFSKDILKLHGYKVLTATNGVEAIEVFERVGMASVDLVLTDINMPKMDGLTAAKTMRNLNPRLKLVFTSGLVTDLDQAKLKTLNFQGYLNKPYTAQNMLATLHDVLTSDNGVINTSVLQERS